jgi:hypothetical protein
LCENKLNFLLKQKFDNSSPRYVLRLIVSEINLFSLSGKASERAFGFKVVDLNLPVLTLLFYVSKASTSSCIGHVSHD